MTAVTAERLRCQGNPAVRTTLGPPTSGPFPFYCPARCDRERRPSVAASPDVRPLCPEEQTQRAVTAKAA